MSLNVTAFVNLAADAKRQLNHHDASRVTARLPERDLPGRAAAAE